MKNKIANLILIAAAALLVVCAVTARAQVNPADTPEFRAALAAPDSPPSTLTAQPSTVMGGLSEIWDALTSGTNDISGQTNWAVIPFVAYDLATEEFGGGAAVLYAVTPNFWAGARVEDIGGRQTTAGVQGQLQVTKKMFGLYVTPFIETSVGIGEDALYGNAGAGLYLKVYGHEWKKASLSVGLIGDYEHYVYGDLEGEQVNAGLLLRFSF